MHEDGYQSVFRRRTMSHLKITPPDSAERGDVVKMLKPLIHDRSSIFSRKIHGISPDTTTEGTQGQDGEKAAPGPVCLDRAVPTMIAA